MDAWHTYSHCLSSKEPEAIVSDLHALNRFADTFSTNNDARTFGIVPYQLPPLPSRLAVDPSAMVNACANHGAEVAMSLEQPRGSAELLITAVEAQNPQEIKRLTRRWIISSVSRVLQFSDSTVPYISFASAQN
jgi:hypothetical protein